LAGVVMRGLIRRFSKRLTLPLEFEVKLNLGPRPHYAYCVYHAARLASRLGIDSISAIEFGVAGGNGLKFLDRFATRVKEELGVTVQVYGFDSGAGLPDVVGTEDLPYWFQASQYQMNVAELQSVIKRAKLVLGNVKNTVVDFAKKFNPPPIGAIFNDLDLYTSTKDSLKLFDQDSLRFLPRVFLYFDDIIGSEWEMYSPCNGQLLAIKEFNDRQTRVHIALNRNLLVHHNVPYRYQTYYAHLKDHPLYCRYVGADEQHALESLLQLRAS
jgi:hypothetical protein